MKKLICLLIIIPFLFISCVEYGDESYRVTFKYLNNTSGNIIITQFGELFEGEDSILQIKAGQNIDSPIHYKKPFFFKRLRFRYMQRKKSGSKTQGECSVIRYDQIRMPVL